MLQIDHDLESHDSVRTNLPSFVNHPHRAAAKFIDQFIARDIDLVLVRLGYGEVQRVV